MHQLIQFVQLISRTIGYKATIKDQATLPKYMYRKTIFLKMINHRSTALQLGNINRFDLVNIFPADWAPVIPVANPVGAGCTETDVSTGREDDLPGVL